MCTKCVFHKVSYGRLFYFTYYHFSATPYILTKQSVNAVTIRAYKWQCPKACYPINLLY